MPDQTTKSDSPEASSAMTFTEHLEELRSCLKVSLLAILVATALAWAFSESLFALFARPLVLAWKEANLGAPKLHFANPIEPFFTYVKTALVAGIFLAAPVVFYQLWRFISPGLTTREQRYALPFVVASTLCFFGGASFGYFVVFPHGFRFFLGFSSTSMGTLDSIMGQTLAVTLAPKFSLAPTLMMSEYFALVWRLLLAFGAIFELPLLIAFLALVGLTTYKTLWRWNPYFVVFAFVISAVLTPPDVVTQTMMAVPLIVLYNLSILIAWAIESSRRKPHNDGGLSAR